MADRFPLLTDEQIAALAHLKAWRYKHSSDPAHSHTYTFNSACLLDYTLAVEEATRAPLLAEIERLERQRDEAIGRAVFAENDSAEMRLMVERLTRERDAALAAQAQTATVADLELMRQARDAIVASGLSGTKTKQARVAAAAALTARLAEPVQASSDVPEANCGRLNAMQEGRDRYTNKASIMAFVEGAWWAAQQLAAPAAAPTVQLAAAPKGGV